MKIDNPYSAENEVPSRDYPIHGRYPYIGLKDWHEQLEDLKQVKIFSGLSSEGLPEMASLYLQNGDIWRKKVKSPYNMEIQLWEGIIVFVLPGKYWRKKKQGYLWENVENCWMKLCCELIPCMGYDYQDHDHLSEKNLFIPTDPVSSWLQELEEQIPGDFACRPYNFGRKFAGYSADAARWEAATLLDGVVTPTWLNSQALITHYTRLQQHHLMLQNAGDRFRYKDRDKEITRGFFIHPPRQSFYFSTQYGADSRSGAGVCLR